MRLEDKIEKEKEKNDRLALEIANLRARLRVLSSTAQLSNQGSRTAQRAVREIDALFDAPLPELLRQKGESNTRLASLKRMLYNRRVAAFAGYETQKRSSESAQAAALRFVAAKLAKSVDLPAQQAPVHTIVSKQGRTNKHRPVPPAKKPKGFSHSDGYASVTTPKGKRFTLTPEQARVIERLHEAWKSMNPELSKSTLLRLLERETSRLPDIFKSTPGAFKALIKPVRRGIYRLNLPNK